MIEEGICQECRFKKITEINNYFIKEMDKNKLLSNKNKNVCTTLNYIEHFLTLVYCMYFHFCFCLFNCYF